MLVNLLAIAWGGAMLINFAWHRVATNPKASETGGLLSFPGFLNDIPILWLVLGFVLILGGLYYAARGTRSPSPRSPTPRGQRSHDWAGASSAPARR